ncbi:hypothetical protein WMY93_015519 [Mugilogobius chulae]|uniref:Protein FAM228B n=1 Tax=Mugilogobius chulae TaxID=88201 RepID=A0AAW0NSZ2_9GOBI
MSPKNKAGPKAFTAPHQQGHFAEEYITDSQTDVAVIKNPSQPSVKPINSSSYKSKREGSNETHKSPRSTQPLERRSCPSNRRLQAKMEIEKHQIKEIVEQLLNTQNGFVKDVEDVLNQHDFTMLRRRELLHKHWTERLWLPFQKQLNQRVSSCGASEIQRRQRLYSQYLQHCNSKGYVFLDTYNPREYDPFLQHKKSDYIKLVEIKNSPKEAWTSNYLESDSTRNSSRRDNKLPHHFQSSLVSSSIATPGTRPGTPSSYSASTSMKTPTGNKTERRRALGRHTPHYLWTVSRGQTECFLQA